MLLQRETALDLRHVHALVESGKVGSVPLWVVLKTRDETASNVSICVFIGLQTSHVELALLFAHLVVHFVLTVLLFLHLLAQFTCVERPLLSSNLLFLILCTLEEVHGLVDVLPVLVIVLLLLFFLSLSHVHLSTLYFLCYPEFILVLIFLILLPLQLLTISLLVLLSH